MFVLIKPLILIKLLFVSYIMMITNVFPIVIMGKTAVNSHEGFRTRSFLVRDADFS